MIIYLPSDMLISLSFLQHNAWLYEQDSIFWGGQKKARLWDMLSVFCRPSGPDNQFPDRVRINMRVDFWERAVCRADPITFLWSRLNSCVYNETLFIVLLNSTWMYGITGALNNFARLSFKHTSLPPPKHVNCIRQLQIDSQTQRQRSREVVLLVASYPSWRVNGSVNLYACGPLKTYLFSTCHSRVISD